MSKSKTKQYRWTLLWRERFDEPLKWWEYKGRIKARYALAECRRRDCSTSILTQHHKGRMDFGNLINPDERLIREKPSWV